MSRYHHHLQVSNHFTKPFGQLHIVVPVFNPRRYVRRYTLFKEFMKHVEHSGATVWVVEIAFGTRPFEVTDASNPQHIQFRSDQEIWLKENVINLAFSRLPLDWEYAAWVDGDIAFLNPHWVQETIHQLQHYSVVQMFEHAMDLNPDGSPGPVFLGFPATVERGHHPNKDVTRNLYYKSYYATTQASPKEKIAESTAGWFHPGYAWAYRREAWEILGGLIDINIVGGGDHQMAHAFYGTISHAIPFQCTTGYRDILNSWQKNAAKLNANVGFVPGTITHGWHGDKINRGYFDRWQILARNEFDPYADLRRDWHGLWKLIGNKPKLRDEMMHYFQQRQEDKI